MSDSDYIISGIPELQTPVDISFSEYLMRQLKLGGNDIAQISNSTGEKTSYMQILQKSVNLAVQLRKLGVQKGDAVAISSENRFEFTVSAIAVMFIGAVNAPLNILYSRNELIHTMNISKPKVVFCSPFTIYNLIDVLDKVSSVKTVISYGDEKPDPSVVFYSDLVKDHVDIESFKTTEVNIMKDPLVILCSSGTTGLPKGVALSNHNFTICCGHINDLMKDLLDSSNCLLSIIPWFHAYGFVSHLLLIGLQMRSVFMVRFEEEPFLRAIQDHKVTITLLVPPLMVFLAKHPLVDKFDLSSLKEIWCGAAPLSKESQIAVTQRIGVKNIKQGYGMTETTLAVLHNGQKEILKYGSCGQVVPGTLAKVVDLETGKNLPPNQKGEICFKGALMMLGYVGDAASTEKIYDSDGWLHTGDIGYYDEDKYFYIVDRLKELIKYKGFQVPPAELEALLLQHPGVKEVGVVGLPDELAGELPVAFVVLQTNVKTTEKELVDFVAKSVSHHKRLHGGVRFIEEIPKNPTGKILRRELKELLLQSPKSKL